MSIGEALAQARRETGLTVTQVSLKTRIREAIIRDIERDDYSACGGDFYARGHIRAIARAAGADSESLIQQYDAAHRAADECEMPGESGSDRFPASGEPRPGGFAKAGESGSDGFVAGGFASPGGPARAEFRAEEFAAPGEYGPREYAAPGEYEPGGYAAPGQYRPGGYVAPGEYEPGGFAARPAFGADGFAAPDEFEPDDFGAPEEITSPNLIATSQMATLEDIMASHQTTVPEESAAPEHVRQAMPAAARRHHRPPPDAVRSSPAWAGAMKTGRPDQSVIRRHRPPNRAAVLAAALALAIIGVAFYLIIPGSRAARPAGSAAAAGAARHRHAPRSSPHPTAASSATAPARRASPTAPAALIPLTPVRAVAFGPGGPGRGDDPQNASLAIDRSLTTAWRTSWYATSHFGNLQAGTGLLLDMGHPVTITAARVTLGPAAGADLQLRVGDSAVLKDLRPVASAANAHRRVPLRLAAPARARYVLVWFTRLPPDPAGTYQAAVYNVRLWGRGAPGAEGARRMGARRVP